MLNRRDAHSHSGRCLAPLISLSLAVLPLLLTGCESSPNAASATPGTISAPPAASASSPTPSPSGTVPVATALPPPPKLALPPPTREDMGQMRKTLDGLSSTDLGKALQLAEAIGDLERVEAIYQSMNKASPGNAMLRYRLADIYHRRLKIPEAQAIYQELNRADPESPVNYLALSDLERMQKHHDAVRDYLAKGIAAIKKGPNEGKYLLMYADPYGALRDKKTQEDLLRKAYAVAPNSSDIILALAKFCKDNGKAPEARQLLDNLVTREPENIEAKRRMAALLAEYSQGAADVDKAGKLLVEIFQSQKMVPDDYMIMGQLMEHDSDWAKAGEAYLSLLNLAPEHQEARFRLTRIYQKLGQTDYSRQVMRDYRQQRKEEENRGVLALNRQLDPLKPQNHLKEAQFAEKTRDYRVAVIAYGLAARLAPKDPEIRQARENFYRFLGWSPPIPEK